MRNATKRYFFVAGIIAVLIVPVSITPSGIQSNTASAAINCTGTPTASTPSTITHTDASSGGQITEEVCKDSAGKAYLLDAGVWREVAVNQQNQKTGVPSNTSCTGTWSVITNPGVCITRALFAGIAAFFIYIGVTFLTAAGLLFEFVLHYTVISFKTPMYDAVSAAIVAAWSAFRDISNILIIGFFTFIAISTILGSHEYGAKKLLARVLIVAVLINFSLLFTKLIIDSSNFLAYQFYNASLSNVDKGGAEGFKNVTGATVDVGGVNAQNKAAQAQVAGAGIAGTFIRYLGVTGIADSYNKVREQQEASDNALYGLAFGLLAFIFLVTVGIVFLYGSFLLISRAILFIFLLITSSLAFATYLIPSLSDKYGWKKWWGSLVSNALLAPVLMMMLWVTLTVSASLSSGLVKNGTLGDLASNTTSTANISALFSYLIILGLLFASFKLASSFSSGIMGFNFASMLPLAGFGIAARAAGLLSMGTIGVGGRYAGNKLAAAGKSAQAKGQGWRAGMFDIAAQTMKRSAKTDFNLANTAFAKQLASGAGLKGAIAGQSGGKGLEGIEKALKERAAEKSERLSYTKEDMEKLRSSELKKAAEGMRDEISRTTGTSASDVNSKTLASSIEAMKQEREAMSQTLEKDMTQLQQEREALNKVVTATGSPAASSRLKEIDDSMVSLIERRTKLGEQDTRIKEAQGLTQKMKEVAQASLPKIIPIEGGDLGKIAKELKEQTAVSAAHQRITNLPFRAAGWSTEDSDRIAQSMRKALKDRDEEKGWKKLATQLAKAQKDEHEHHEKVERHDARMERATEHIAEHSAGDRGAKH